MSSVFIGIVVVFSILFWVGFVVAIVRAVRKTRAWAGATSDDWSVLALKLEADRDGQGIYGRVSGKPFRCRYEAGTRKHSVSFAVRLEHPFPEVVKLAKEGSFHRLCKHIGLEVEVETGDPAFDDRFYVNADNPDYARALLGDAEDRARLIALDEACQGHSESVSIVLDREGIAVSLVNYRRGSLAAGDLRAILERMAPLAAPVPAQTAAHARGSHGSDKLQRAAWILYCVLGGVGTFIAAIVAAKTYEPIENALYARALTTGALGWVGFVAMAFLLIRGRSWSGPIYVAAVLTSLVIFPAGSIAGHLLYNGRADPGPETVRATRIASHYTTRSKNSTTYHLVVDPWREGLEPPHFTVSRALHESLFQNAPVEVVTRPGALGFEWRVAVRPGAVER